MLDEYDFPACRLRAACMSTCVQRPGLGFPSGAVGLLRLRLACRRRKTARKLERRPSRVSELRRRVSAGKKNTSIQIMEADFT